MWRHDQRLARPRRIEAGRADLSRAQADTARQSLSGLNADLAKIAFCQQADPPPRGIDQAHGLLQRAFHRLCQTQRARHCTRDDIESRQLPVPALQSLVGVFHLTSGTGQALGHLIKRTLRATDLIGGPGDEPPRQIPIGYASYSICECEHRAREKPGQRCANHHRQHGSQHRGCQGLPGHLGENTPQVQLRDAYASRTGPPLLDRDSNVLDQLTLERDRFQVIARIALDSMETQQFRGKTVAKGVGQELPLCVDDESVPHILVARHRGQRQLLQLAHAAAFDQVSAAPGQILGSKETPTFRFRRQDTGHRRPDLPSENDAEQAKHHQDHARDLDAQADPPNDLPDRCSLPP